MPGMAYRVDERAGSISTRFSTLPQKKRADSALFSLPAQRSGCLSGGRLLEAEHPALRIHPDRVLRREAAGQDFLGQRVFEFALDRTFERARADHLIATGLGVGESVN